MQDDNSQNAIIILDRLKGALKITTDLMLAEVLGVKQPTLSTWKKRNTMDYPLIITFCNNAGLDLNFIFTGIGEKGNLKGNPSGNLKAVKEVISQNNIVPPLFTQPKVVTINQNNEDVIAMVPTKAAAGYLNGYADPEFVETLPTLYMPGLKGGLHRAFEVKGMSMLPVHHPGSISIGRYVESANDIRDRRVYIIVTKEGVVLKRVLNRLKDDGVLILISDNENKREYPNYPIYPEDILEMWYWRRSVIAESPEPGNLYNRFNDLQGDVALLRAEIAQMKGKTPPRLNN